MMKKSILAFAAASMMSFNVASLHAEKSLNDSLFFQCTRVFFQLAEGACKTISEKGLSLDNIRAAYNAATYQDCEKAALYTGIVAAMLAFINNDNCATAAGIAWSPEATALALTAGSATFLTVLDNMSWSNFYTKAGLSAMILTLATAITQSYSSEEDAAYYQRFAKTLVTIIGPSALCAGLASEPNEGRDILTGFGAVGTFGSALAWLR